MGICYRLPVCRKPYERHWEKNAFRNKLKPCHTHPSHPEVGALWHLLLYKGIKIMQEHESCEKIRDRGGESENMRGRRRLGLDTDCVLARCNNVKSSKVHI